MTYRDNVTALAMKHDIVNDPRTGLQEEDLGIGGLYFWFDHNNSYIPILGGKMNRATRLFLEHHTPAVNDKKPWRVRGDKLMELKKAAPEYFAELWEDTSERPLLDALKHADSIVIYWKSNPTWLEDFNNKPKSGMI